MIEEAHYSEAPPWLRKRKMTPAQRKGISYEKAMARLLANDYQVQHGQWIKYKRKGRWKWCQPDLIVTHENRIYVIEVKLTARPRSAKTKLLSLYVPIMQLIYPGREVVPVQLCKNLTKRSGSFVTLSDLPQLKEYSLVHHPFVV